MSDISRADSRLQSMRRVLKTIADDMTADAMRFDGMPFNGRTVAEYFGNHGAAIAALANILEEIVEEALRARGATHE